MGRGTPKTILQRYVLLVARREERSEACEECAAREMPNALVVNFFLDIELKEPYKGDTTALSQEGAKI